jgi:uncharacterized protein DUF3237
MRLDLLCEMTLEYRHEELVGGQYVQLKPYGTAEALAYGEGDGTVEGTRLAGRIRWVNHPRQRSDEVVHPDIHGMIRTEDDAVVLFSLQGQTVFQDRKGMQLLTAQFAAEDERYKWLNNALCVLEGVVQNRQMRGVVYQCINELG